MSNGTFSHLEEKLLVKIIYDMLAENPTDKNIRKMYKLAQKFHRFHLPIPERKAYKRKSLLEVVVQSKIKKAKLNYLESTKPKF